MLNVNIQKSSAADANAKKQEVNAATFNNTKYKNTSYTRPYQLVPDSSSSNVGAYKIKSNGSSGHTFDIVNNFIWTTSKFKEEVPRIQLSEYQITQNQQAAFFANTTMGILERTKDAAGNLVDWAGATVKSAENYTMKDPYEGLYSAEPTLFSYIFPYYANTTISSRTQWSSKIPPAGEHLAVAAGTKLAGGLLEKYAGNEGRDLVEKYAVNAAATFENPNAPFAGIEQPMYYTGTNKNNYTVKFPLFNTFSTTEILRNYDFIRVFSYQNLHLRSTFATYQPPVFYKCEQVPGYWSELGEKPALYVSDFSVTNVGAIRAIDIGMEGKKVSIPEAYMIEITFSEMITTSRNIYSSIFTGEGLSVMKKESSSSSTSQTPSSRSSSPGNRPPEFTGYESNLNLAPGVGMQSLPAVDPLPIPPRFQSSPRGLQ
jgi:hypothetical protein